MGKVKTPSVHWWDWKNPLPCRWVKIYVHVKVYTTEEGRFMLIGLSKRKDRVPDKSNMTEQLWKRAFRRWVWANGSMPVFPISGNPGAELHHLLIVPDFGFDA